MGRPIGFLLLGAGFLFANRNCRRRKARSHTLVSLWLPAVGDHRLLILEVEVPPALETGHAQLRIV